MTYATKKAIIATLEPHKNLHARIDYMEAQVNYRLKDLTMPYLARFAAELKKAQKDIMKFKREWQPQEFPIPGFKESEEDVPLDLRSQRKMYHSLICWESSLKQ
ncbi:hypothetical protein HAX54_003189 [Datura stramonium]|uniref:Uncharacterized protein n=1 Tax=Datura stramonium TaxID=4076 RepID=A0ABS8WW08_DATST|nr:hypothetical protein [Datura stramonium]